MASSTNKQYNGIGNGNGNANQVDTRQISITDPKNNRTFSISIYDYIEFVNGIKASNNALDICNNLGITKPDQRSLALQYSITYKKIFKGIDITEDIKLILKTINCDVKPVINSKTITSICYITWKLNDYKNKQIFNIHTVEWVGMLAGLVMYFNEVDELTSNTNKNSIESTRDYVVNDI